LLSLLAFDYFNPSSPTHKFDPFVKQKRAGLLSSVSSAEALLGRIVKLKKNDSGLQVSNSYKQYASPPML
jgi:hypothetical protein